MLFAVGIEGVGDVTGRALAQQFRTIDALRAASPEEIARTPGIGPIVGGLIHEQLADDRLWGLIEALRARGIRFEEDGPPPGEGVLSGRTFVPGTLPELTREQATERIRRGARSPRRCGRSTTWWRATAPAQARQGRAPGSRC